MSDTLTQLRSSNEAQAIVQEMTEDANKLLGHVNDLFNAPADKDAFLHCLRGAARITNCLAQLNRLVRHEF